MRVAVVGVILFIICLLVNCVIYGFFSGLFTVAAAIGLFLAAENNDDDNNRFA